MDIQEILYSDVICKATFRGSQEDEGKKKSVGKGLSDF